MDWLQSYWGVVVAFVTVGGGLIGIAVYLNGLIEKHAPFRIWIAKWLVVPSYHDAYRDWLGRRLAGLQVWMGGHWSGTAFARCLAIALAYPAALLLISYGLGGPGTVGTTEFFPRLGGWRQPGLGFGLLAGMVGFGLVFAFSERIDRHLLRGMEGRLERRGIANPGRRAQWLYRIGGASAVASILLATALYAGASLVGAAALAGAVNIALVLALALAGAVNIALAGAGAGAVALAGAGVLAFAGAGALVLAAAALWLLGVVPYSLAFVLFFVMLPIANALLDWPSWAISRWLGQDVHDLMHGRARRFGRFLHWLFRGFWKPASFGVHVAADVMAAIVLLAALAVLLPFLIQAFNIAVVAAGGEAPLELHGYLQAAADQPWPNGAWAITMLLTTLVPTALHAGAAIVMLLLLPLQPVGWRARLAAGLATKDDSDRAWAATRASWLVIVTPLVAGALVLGLAYGLVGLIGAVWQPVATLLLHAAQLGTASANDLALLIGWLPGSVGI